MQLVTERLVGVRASELSDVERRQLSTLNEERGCTQTEAQEVVRRINKELRASRLRAALHLMRSTMPLVQILRCDGLPPESTDWGDVLGQLDSHRRRVIQLLHAARKVATRTMYVDEFLWLYNEFGVTCLAQGDVIEARSLFEQGVRLRERLIGREPDHAWAHFQIQIALTEIHRGMLGNARHLLMRVVERHLDKHSRLGTRAHGYLALINHLSGNTDGAADQYSDVIVRLRNMESLRALSYFHRRRGDLYRKGERIEKAHADYDASIAAAAGEPDLLHYARIAKARLSIAKAGVDVVLVNSDLDSATSYARRVGLAPLHGEVARIRAELRLIQGDHDTAAVSALEALGIFARRDMKLRVASILILLAKILLRRGDRGNARRILESVRDATRSMLYVSKMKEATEVLGRLGPSEEGDDTSSPVASSAHDIASASF